MKYFQKILTTSSLIASLVAPAFADTTIVDINGDVTNESAAKAFKAACGGGSSFRRGYEYFGITPKVVSLKKEDGNTLDVIHVGTLSDDNTPIDIYMEACQSGVMNIVEESQHNSKYYVAEQGAPLQLASDLDSVEDIWTMRADLQKDLLEKGSSDQIFQAWITSSTHLRLEEPLFKYERGGSLDKLSQAYKKLSPMQKVLGLMANHAYISKDEAAFVADVAIADCRQSTGANAGVATRKSKYTKKPDLVGECLKGYFKPIWGYLSAMHSSDSFFIGINTSYGANWRGIIVTAEQIDNALNQKGYSRATMNLGELLKIYGYKDWAILAFNAAFDDFFSRFGEKRSDNTVYNQKVLPQ